MLRPPCLALLSFALAACGLAPQSPNSLQWIIAGLASAAEPTHTPGLPSPQPTATSLPLPAADTPPPTETSPPTATRVPSATPTAQAVVEPTLGYYNITPAPDATLATPFPTPVSPVELDQNLVNVLLIGTDYRATERSYRTDTLIIVSINKETALVTMLSIPRDLYVYIPTWGMSRINKAYQDGETSQYPGGGPGLLAQTILYNLGVPIHYYALANFDGFRQVVDTLGGIEVPVNCQLTEYKIKDPTLDESVAENYELHTQPVGVTRMDGALALWYARARPVGGDFFRGYRQRQVLRAIYHTALKADMIPRLPELYGSFAQVIHTNMGLWDVMQFVPLTTRLDDTRIRSLYIGPNQTTSWRTPSGEDVLLPRPEAMQALIKEAFAAPAQNQLLRPVTWVEIWNTTPHADWAALAAETLANEGFAPLIGQPDGAPYATTAIVDFTTSPKGSSLAKLQFYTHVADKDVVAQPDPNSPVQFRLILAEDYDPCPRLDWMDRPREAATPTPETSSPAEPPTPTP